MTEDYSAKASNEEIEKRFDHEVELFSNLEHQNLYFAIFGGIK